MTSLALRSARSAVSYLPSSSLLALRSLPERLRRNVPHEADFAWFAGITKPSPVVIDIGANRGQSIRSLQLFLTTPCIHAIEPNPLLASHLATNAELGGGSITNVALSDGTGTLVLYVPRYGHTHYDTRASASRDQAASFLTSDSFLGFTDSRSGVERIEVEMRTLDSLELAPDIIKIDVEGAELGVLTGGSHTITEHQPVMLIEEPSDQAIELARSWGYESFEYRNGTLQPATGNSLNTFFLVEKHRVGPDRLVN